MIREVSRATISARYLLASPPPAVTDLSSFKGRVQYGAARVAYGASKPMNGGTKGSKPTSEIAKSADRRALLTRAARSHG